MMFIIQRTDGAHVSMMFLTKLQIQKKHEFHITKLLTKGDRLILITVVLDSLLTYYMLVFLIPKMVLKTIDALKSAFF